MSIIRVERTPGHIKATDFGATGDGTTDDYPALQRALDKFSAQVGGEVEFPAGSYFLSNALTANTANLRLVSKTGPGLGSVVGRGGTRLLAANGKWGFTFAEGAASHVHRGPHIEGLSFEPASGATPLGGIWIDNASNARIVDTTVSDMVGGTGIKLGDTGRSASQYHEMRGVTVHRCTTGIDLFDSNGLRMFGGYFEYNDGGAAAIKAGATAIKIRVGSDTARLFGVVIQGFETGIEVGANFGELFGCRFETIGTGISLLSGVTYWDIFGGTMTNSSLGGTVGTGIKIADGVNRATIFGVQMTAMAIGIDDLRTNKTPSGNTNWITKQANGYFEAPFLVAGVVDTAVATFKGMAGQTGDLTRWKDSANTTLAWVDSTGRIRTTKKVLATEGIGVGNSAAATTLGTVTKKIEVFDASGASLGFVPVYDGIA